VAPGWEKGLLQRMRDYYQTPYLWMADSWDNFRRGGNRVKHAFSPHVNGKEVTTITKTGRREQQAKIIKEANYGS